MTEAPPTEAPTAPSPKPPPAVASEELLRGGRELVIRHGRETYLLRVTATGKLILTK